MCGYKELIPIYDSHKSFYRKAHVHIFDDYAYLVSYNAVVCFIDFSDNSIHRLWGGYSATTMRHINEFIKQYADYPENTWFSKSDWENMIVERSCY